MGHSVHSRAPPATRSVLSSAPPPLTTSLSVLAMPCVARPPASQSKELESAPTELAQHQPQPQHQHQPLQHHQANAPSQLPSHVPPVLPSVSLNAKLESLLASSASDPSSKLAAHASRRSTQASLCSAQDQPLQPQPLPLLQPLQPLQAARLITETQLMAVRLMSRQSKFKAFQETSAPLTALQLLAQLMSQLA